MNQNTIITYSRAEMIKNHLVCEIELMNVCFLAEKWLTISFIIYGVSYKSSYVFFDSS